LFRMWHPGVAIARASCGWTGRLVGLLLSQEWDGQNRAEQSRAEQSKAKQSLISDIVGGWVWPEEIPIVCLWVMGQIVWNNYLCIWARLWLYVWWIPEVWLVWDYSPLADQSNNHFAYYSRPRQAAAGNPRSGREANDILRSHNNKHRPPSEI
jgi:hypothetical protein